MSNTEALLIDEYDYEGLPGSTPLAANLIAGAFAGIAEHTLMYPVDAIKTRMQIVQPTPVAVYSGVTNAITKISTTEGWRTLWKGMTSVILGAGPAHAVYFGTYELTKEYLVSERTPRDLTVDIDLLFREETLARNIILC